MENGIGSQGKTRGGGIGSPGKGEHRENLNNNVSVY